MTTDIGLFYARHAFPDDVWNQCDGALGQHGAIEFRFQDRGASHVLCLGPPIPPKGGPRPGGVRRHLLKWTGGYERERIAMAFRALGRDPGDVTMLVFEPPSWAPDAWYAGATGLISRVYAPDPRATHPIQMPALWQIDLAPSVLRDLLPPEKVQTLVAISSGKAETPGHRERLGFLALLRRAGVPLALFGRGLPLELGALGELRSKSTALLPAMFTLAIENHSEGELYVSEKAWDPLLCWSLPLYHGPRAIDAMVPPGSFIRLPDLQDAGVDAVRAALAGGAELWRSRLDAIAEARRRVLGDLRMVEWVRRTLVPERRA